MRTAVLISGQMRTFAQCYPTHREQIFRHYEPDIHFFVSCAHDAQSESAFLLEKDYKNVHFERYQDDLNLPEIPIEKGAWAPYANAASHRALMLQHWGNYKAMQWFLKEKKEEFDTIIRIRPDLWIHRHYFSPPKPGRMECYCPWWGKFGGLNDRLAIMGSGCLDAYFGILPNIQRLIEEGCPFHPESLLKRSLEENHVVVKNTLMCSFSTQRTDGTRRWPEQSMDDLAELTYELHQKPFFEEKAALHNAKLDGILLMERK